MKIKCTICNEYIIPEEITGEKIYPHRPDLYKLKFMQCKKCKNYVGTHPDGRPLGSIVSKEIKKSRMEIHNNLDQLWKNNVMKRKEVYSHMRQKLGYEYHTANIETKEEAEKVLTIARELHDIFFTPLGSFDVVRV